MTRGISLHRGTVKSQVYGSVSNEQAVQEWFAKHDAYHKASEAYNARLEYVRERRKKYEDWSENPQSEYRVLGDAQREAIAAAETLYQTLKPAMIAEQGEKS